MEAGNASYEPLPALLSPGGEPDRELLDAIDDVVRDLVNQVLQGEAPRLEPLNQHANSVAISFLSNPLQFTRVLSVLESAQEAALRDGKNTQRDLFYGMKEGLPAGVVGSVQETYSAVNRACELLLMERNRLHITSSSKGLVAGNLSINKDGPWLSGTSTQAGIPIPGDLDVLARMHVRISSNCRCILVVEKDAIFQRLLDDKLFDLVPCVLITGKGVPDLATRMLLRKLHEQAGPALPVIGLADYNPSGVGILCVYRFGALKDAAESRSFRVDCSVPLQWLGVRSEHLAVCDGSESSGCGGAGSRGQARRPLSEADLRLLGGMLRRDAHVPVGSAWREELLVMQAGAVKAEIEAVANWHGPQFAEWVARNVLQRRWI
ncbi:unnamed protein product [Pedinophyceae sp. YPF-701]|nr:unnamed protein product [Pedinophyceae sp. YPF-701]